MGPAVIWLIGLSGAGKSSLAKRLVEYLRQHNVMAEHLDGDIVRSTRPRGFSRIERLEHLNEVAIIAADKERSGLLVVGSFITPYQEARNNLRQKCQKYIEVWVDSELEDCEKRDVKGLYAKARSGEIKNFTGISDVFESPLNSDIHLVTKNKTENESLKELIEKLENFFK
ncbi:MAG: adenylyl-sulfate kinase [Bacteriovoracaceae bacterium]|nr:adenylyl-sulfate kinase [Bacteriovoracaceae bacterium]